MKKLISLILSTAFILSICLTSVSVSAQSNLTRSDAINFFKNANDLFNILQNKYSEESDVPPNIICDESDLYTPLELNDSRPCKRILKIELLDKEYDIEIFSDVVDAIEDYYVPELVELVMISSIDKDKTIYEGTNGKAYFHEDDWMPWPNYVVMNYGAFTSTDNNAALEVYSRRTVGLDVYYCKANIEFTNTESGWRVSGGSMFDLLTSKVDYMDYCYKYSFVVDDDIGRQEIILNPDTGDTSSYTIPALTVAALISVALPVGIMRKRRRSA